MSSTEFNVESSLGDYSVRIERGAFKRDLGTDLRSDPIIADAFFRERPDFVNRTVSFVEASEEKKTLKTVETLIDFLRESGVVRDSNIVAVGGGVTQDIVTLVAALYMRGISWTYYPTTTLGMIDSCLGGKSSINTSKAKNLIGNIYPPTKVVIDTEFIETLSVIDRVCGIVEGIKITFCGGPTDFQVLCDLLDEPKMSIEDVILTALTTKKRFVEHDEFDVGIRQLLNFGHTFGHALEVGSAYRIPHGIAVAYGMIAAINFCEAMGLPVRDDTPALLHRCQWAIKQVKHLLPDWKFDVESMVAAFRTDKKHSATHFRLILPLSNGVERITVDRTSLNEELLIRQLREAVESA